MDRIERHAAQPVETADGVGMRTEHGALGRSIFPVIGLIALFIVCVTLMVMLAGRELDRTAKDGSEKLMSTAVRLLGERPGTIAKDYSLLSDTLIHVIWTPDRGWMANRFGRPVLEVFDLDGSIVLSNYNETLFSAFSTDMSQYRSRVPDVLSQMEPLIASARDATPGTHDPIWSLIRLDESYFFAGVAAVRTGRRIDAVLSELSPPVLIFLLKFDERRLSEIESNFGLPNVLVRAGFEGENRSSNDASIALTGPMGEEIGRLFSRVRTPTIQFLEIVSVPLVVVGLVSLLLVALIVRRALESHVAMTRKAQELAVSNELLLESEAQAKSALQKAEHAARAKSGFLANVSHELRTPLTAILGFSQILKLRHRPGKARSREEEYADMIHQSSQHLLNLVNDLLDLAKIETGGYELHETWIDVDREIRGAVGMMSAEAIKRGVTLEVSVPGELPALYADQKAVRQILLNLISNALKFTERGGRTDVRVKRTSGSLALEVQDNGLGIPPDQQEEIWQPFNRTSNPAVTKTEGTGLGLNLVKILTDLHSGTVHLESAPGVGTTVVIVFPEDRLRSVAA